MKGLADMTTPGSKKLFLSAFLGACLLSVLSVYAGSSTPQIVLPGLDPEKLENLPLREFHQRLLDLGLMPAWSHVPNQQAAIYSKDFWCKKTWIVTWEVRIIGEEPVATEIIVQFFNACD